MIIRRKLLGRAAAVAGVVLALVSTGIAQASVPQSETRSGVSGTGIKYVALGDSRASGPRLEPMYPDACSRSYENFAGKISRALEVAEFTDVSCSAARAENIIDTPQLIPNYWPVQLDAVHPDTDLITISIGGNDSNSIFLGPLCVAPGPGTDRGCRYDPLANSVAQSGIDRAAGELDRILTAVTQRAPNARIYLIGEGGMISSRGCWPNIPFSDADASWFMDYFARYNTKFDEVAHAHGVRTVDIAAASIAGGHDACASADQRWFEGLFSESTAQRLHFTDAGMTAVADLVVADVQG
ncbi:SGNH/GDSL hydrolase family protein [Rhodococcus qingshengii]|uniref:SGNH/GDSL hydrolase family protein n=1 Tax=Rhodococcus qingshengii TaxID=334542 RepID=UPI002798D499|nr:SGNH/GDSL hydrolase family protein [Rhodococcus qingshengii]